MIKKILIFAFLITALELIVYFQNLISIIVIIITLLILLSLATTIKLKTLHKIGFLGQLNISIFPLFFLISIIVFLIFIPSKFFFQHIYIIISSLLFTLSISCTKKALIDLENRKSLAASDFLITISAFLLYSSIFGLYLFLSWPAWLLMILLLISTFVLAYEFFWYNQLFKKHIIYALILTLVISEIGWALTLWPTGFISRSIVIFALFYIFTNLSKHHFKKTLNKKIVRNYIIISLIVILLVLFTTKWTF